MGGMGGTVLWKALKEEDDWTSGTAKRLFLNKRLESREECRVLERDRGKRDGMATRGL